MMQRHDIIPVNRSGRGGKDINTVVKLAGIAP